MIISFLLFGLVRNSWGKLICWEWKSWRKLVSFRCWRKILLRDRKYFSNHLFPFRSLVKSPNEMVRTENRKQNSFPRNIFPQTDNLKSKTNLICLIDQRKVDSMSKAVTFNLHVKNNGTWVTITHEHISLNINKICIIKMSRARGLVPVPNLSTLVMRGNMLKKLLTERLFMRRYSTSSIVSLVRSAMTFNGIVRSSAGRLHKNRTHLKHNA